MSITRCTANGHAGTDQRLPAAAAGFTVALVVDLAVGGAVGGVAHSRSRGRGRGRAGRPEAPRFVGWVRVLERSRVPGGPQ